MKISLEELRAHGQKCLAIKEELSAETLAIKPVVGELAVAVNSSGATVVGHLKTIFKLNCHSCLRPFFQAVNLAIDEHFVYEEYITEGALELREKELRKGDFVEVIPYAGAIDISDIVYQAVTLANPVHCSCGADCPGILPSPGQGAAAASPDGGTQSGEVLGVDPRWKNLKTLFPKDDS